MCAMSRIYFCIIHFEFEMCLTLLNNFTIQAAVW